MVCVAIAASLAIGAVFAVAIVALAALPSSLAVAAVAADELRQLVTDVPDLLPELISLWIRHDAGWTRAREAVAQLQV